MPPNTEAWIQYGALGLICVFLIWWIVRQDRNHRTEINDLRKELKSEQDGRVEDAKAFSTTALALQQKVIEAVSDIRDIVGEYGSLGTTVGELARVLKDRNGRSRYRDTERP